MESDRACCASSRLAALRCTSLLVVFAGSRVSEALFTGGGNVPRDAFLFAILSILCFYFWEVSLVVGRWLEPAAGAAVTSVLVLVLVFVFVLLVGVFCCRVFVVGACAGAVIRLGREECAALDSWPVDRPPAFLVAPEEKAWLSLNEYISSPLKCLPPPPPDVSRTEVSS